MAYLDFLAIDARAVQVLASDLGVTFVLHGDEGEPLARVEHVHDLSDLAELGLQDVSRTGAAHAIDENLCAGLRHLKKWGTFKLGNSNIDF